MFHLHPLTLTISSQTHITSTAASIYPLHIYQYLKYEILHLSEKRHSARFKSNQLLEKATKKNKKRERKNACLTYPLLLM